MSERLSVCHVNASLVCFKFDYSLALFLLCPIERKNSIIDDRVFMGHWVMGDGQTDRPNDHSRHHPFQDILKMLSGMHRIGISGSLLPPHCIYVEQLVYPRNIAM